MESGHSVKSEAEQEAMLDEIVQRVSALPEGRAMVRFIIDHDYSVSFAPSGRLAGCSAATKELMFNPDASVDEIVAHFPHEAFHVMQYETVPAIANWSRLFLAGGDAQGTLAGAVLAKPADLAAAMNIMEIAAYAVGTDFVWRLAETGDTKPLEIYRKQVRLTDTYEAVIKARALDAINLNGQHIADVSAADAARPELRNAFASAVTGRLWYWGAKDMASGAPLREVYHAGLLSDLADICESRRAPCFNHCAAGDAPPTFVALGASDIEALGQGYRFNPLKLPGFDDIASPKYMRNLGPGQAQAVSRIETAFKRP